MYRKFLSLISSSIIVSQMVIHNWCCYDNGGQSNVQLKEPPKLLFCFWSLWKLCQFVWYGFWFWVWSRDQILKLFLTDFAKILMQVFVKSKVLTNTSVFVILDLPIGECFFMVLCLHPIQHLQVGRLALEQSTRMLKPILQSMTFSGCFFFFWPSGIHQRG